MHHHYPERSPPGTFDLLIQPLQMTAGGRPALLEGEIELVAKECVTLLARAADNTFEPRLEDGTATVTTHRLLWQGEYQGRPMHVHITLAQLREVRANPDGRWKSSSKLQLWALGQGAADSSPAAMAATRAGRDELLSSLVSAMERKAWVTVSATEVVARRLSAQAAAAGGAGAEFNHGAGIAGILRRQEATRATTKEMASEAFADLNSLMSKAKEVVAVIERYQAAQATVQAEGTSGDASTSSGSASDLSAVLLNIGFISPVTKETAGTQYHEQLARQLADFLGPRAGGTGLLQHVGGMMTLPDVYAMFNRARGTQLISPQDLLAVSGMLAPLGLGMRLRTFGSGVAVIQADAYDEAAVGKRLSELAQQSPLMVQSVAAAFKVSLVLAGEHLRAAEASGLLCRDEVLEGVRFYPNRFPEFTV